MLPPYIIEQIRRREVDEARQPQPVVELPIAPRRNPAIRESEPPGEQRGVIVIDLG